MDKIFQKLLMLCALLFNALIFSVNEDEDWVIIPRLDEVSNRIKIMLPKRTETMPKRYDRAQSKSPVRASRMDDIQPEIKSVSVLQQNSSEPWIVRGTNLERLDAGKIFGDPDRNWKNLREADGTNCAYDALKNLRILMSALKNRSIDIDRELDNPNSVLSKQLNNLEELTRDIAVWSGKVYDGRKAAVVKHLRDKGLRIPERDSGFKDMRKELPDPRVTHSSLRSYVNSNDGHIQTNDLDGREVEKLLEDEPKELRDQVMVLEYIPGLPISTMLTEKMERQILKFQHSPDAELGILWNEEDFHHWVAYVAKKRNGRITIYEMNSTQGKKPQNVPVLLNLLKGH